MIDDTNEELKAIQDPALPTPALKLEWSRHDTVTIYFGPNPNPEICTKVRIWYFPGIVTREKVEADLALVGMRVPVNWIDALSWNGWLADVSRSPFIHKLDPPLPHSINYWAQWLSRRGYGGTLGEPFMAAFPAR